MAKEAGQDMGQLGEKVRTIKDKGAVQQLLQSDDTKRMMELLGSRNNVTGAAKAAAAGDPAQLMGMMQQLMNTQEGAKLVERITQKARESGL